MDGIMTIDELVDAIIDYLEWDVWENVGAFIENIDSALRLPLKKRMSWKLSSPSPYALLMLDGDFVAYGSGETLQEAICRAWFMWRRANDTEYNPKDATND